MTYHDFMILRGHDIFRSKRLKILINLKWLFCVCYFTIASFKKLTSEELMFLTKLRNVDSYKKLSRQKLVSIFATAPSNQPSPRPKNQCRKSSDMLQDLNYLYLKSLYLLQSLTSIHLMTTNQKDTIHLWW